MKRGSVAGGSASHIPVLVGPALQFLNIHDRGVYIDATFGAGGYTRAILSAANTTVIAIDRDPTAIAHGAKVVEQMRKRVILIRDRFSQLARIVHNCGFETVDGVVLDIGVSSMQLDTPERGFSFRFDGPLDMRMGKEGPSVADVINRASERDLANIIFRLGEERFSRQIARAIIKARGTKPIESTHALADLVASVVRIRPGDIHPATRTFQALRIFVNDELRELVTGLLATENVLKPEGRLVVISFHSLEDIIVKSFLISRAEARAGSRHAPEIKREAPSFTILTKRPIIPDDEEVARNPRARSAKLRAAERTDALPHDGALRLLPALPSLTDVLKGH
jgi:16S rRNA (cytosine1402-N4)-methyltransferase